MIQDFSFLKQMSQISFAQMILKTADHGKEMTRWGV